METNHKLIHPQHSTLPSLEWPSSPILLDIPHSPTHNTSPSEVIPFFSRKSTRMRGAPLKCTEDYHAYLSKIQYTGINSICTLIMIDSMTRNISLSEALRDLWWVEAIQKELDALVKNGTWKLVTLPFGKKLVLSSKWVLKVKSEHSYKDHLVVKGYEQREGINKLRQAFCSSC